MAVRTKPLVIKMTVAEFLVEMMARCKNATELEAFLKRVRNDFDFEIDTGNGIVSAEEWLIDARVFFGN